MRNVPYRANSLNSVMVVCETNCERRHRNKRVQKCRIGSVTEIVTCRLDRSLALAALGQFFDIEFVQRAMLDSLTKK